MRTEAWTHPFSTSILLFVSFYLLHAYRLPAMTGLLPPPSSGGFMTSADEEQERQDKRRWRPIGLLWKDFFRDPLQWWDNRSSRASQPYPHFQHKVTGDRLWVDGRLNPPWVRDELRERGLTPSIHREHPEQGKLLDLKTSAQSRAFVALLRSCTLNKDLFRGIRTHDEILSYGFEDACVDALITMYATCGALMEAKDLLIQHKSKDVITWTALIAAYARHGRNQDALNLFERMKQEGLSPDAITLASALKACGAIKAADMGKRIHEEVARQGLLGSDVVLGNALIDMYAKCGHLAEAQQVLEELPCRDVVSWNTLIAGYAQHDQAEQALACLEQLQSEALSPDAVTFACILKACGTLRAIDKGEQVHDQIVSQGLLGKNVVLGTALVDMYAKCGALVKARRMLEELSPRDIVSWNTLMSGYARQGQVEEVLQCLRWMQQEGIHPSPVTFGCIFKACGITGAVCEGEQFHEVIQRQRLLEVSDELGTALVDMYAKCGALVKAAEVLEGLPFRDAVSWCTLIAGYVREGKGEQALHCFEQMQQEGFYPDAITFACMLKACVILGAVNRGEKIHNEILKQDLLQNDMVLGSALVDMYAKCGILGKAQQVLKELPSRDIVSWNTLIAGYAQKGESEQVLHCFRQMQSEGFWPDASTFSSMLTSCCHLGRIEEGYECFVSMSTRYGVKPDVDHYTCMVDLFGRAGHLDKAMCLVQEMPFPSHHSMVSALLGACRKWGDVSVGRWAFERALQLNRSDGAAYVLFSDIHSAAGMQEYAERIEAMSRDNKAS